MLKNNPHSCCLLGIFNLKATNHQTSGMNGKDRKWVSSYPHIKNELETCLGFKLRALIPGTRVTIKRFPNYIINWLHGLPDSPMAYQNNHLYVG